MTNCNFNKVVKQFFLRTPLQGQFCAHEELVRYLYLLNINVKKLHCTKNEILIKDFFSKCDPADLVPFTEEILNEKLHFLCSASSYIFDGTPNTPLQMFQEKKTKIRKIVLTFSTLNLAHFLNFV